MTEPTRLLRDLVALPSVNPMGRALSAELINEHRVTAYLENFFRGLGVSCERQTISPGRDNIVARCELPGAKKTLLLEAHQDTVPVDGMTIDPFAARIDGNRLYGRGARHQGGHGGDAGDVRAACQGKAARRRSSDHGVHRR